jgi:ATP-dependent RNA helicase DeaD
VRRELGDATDPGAPPSGGDADGSRFVSAEEDHEPPPLEEPVSGAEAAAAYDARHVGEEPEPAVETKFAEFPLPSGLLKAIQAVGYIEPTEVQRRMIPLAMEGKNVVARSRTGTGKTCAFLVPALARLPECADGSGVTSPRGPVRMLAVVPTRELALQVAGEAAKLSKFLPVETACVYGGTRFPAQVAALRTAALVVGTPGRLLDHLGRGTLNLARVETVVLDEVDRMYDLGFREDVDKLLRYAAARRQTLLLSATLNSDVERLIARHVPQHERFEVASSSLTVDEVQQTFYVVDHDRKQDLLMAVAEQRNPTRCIVFVRTKFAADRVAWRLQQKGFQAQEIHSGLQQRRREQILQGFREGAFPLMVATDVASRGLDIQGVDHVINMDIPENPEDYVHRVGRTARMGKEGWAITFVTPDDGPFLTTIEKLINKEIKQETFPGFEVMRRQPAAAPKPVAPPPVPGTPAPQSPGIPQWNRPARRRR